MELYNGHTEIQYNKLHNQLLRTKIQRKDNKIMKKKEFPLFQHVKTAHTQQEKVMNILNTSLSRNLQETICLRRCTAIIRKNKQIIIPYIVTIYTIQY